jgi:DNA-binding response OmpR family regulator
MPAQAMQNDDIIRVLIVEDEESFLAVLTNVLRSAKQHAIVPCQTGESALEALKISQFDVVILDLTLPGISGLNVLQWMNEQKLDTPVIILTGTGSEFLAAETMKLGAYDYIAKEDFDNARLPAVVSEVVQRYLFKKNKLEEEAKGGGKDLASLYAFSHSITSLAHVANTALATVTLLAEECQQTLYPLLNPEAREQLRKDYEAIKQEHDVIISVTKSILELSQAMYNRYEATRDFPEPQKNIPAKAEQPQQKDPKNTPDNNL